MEKLTFTRFYLRFVVSAILDLQLKTTSGDVAYITVESGTSENMGIAVGISLIAALEPEISWW